MLWKKDHELPFDPDNYEEPLDLIRALVREMEFNHFDIMAAQ